MKLIVSGQDGCHTKEEVDVFVLMETVLSLFSFEKRTASPMFA